MTAYSTTPGDDDPAYDAAAAMFECEIITFMTSSLLWTARLRRKARL
jgi:hypothetical protein